MFEGSDIGGSIRMPAYFNGIFGHKPSRYIVSNIGQYPIPESDLLNSFLGKQLQVITYNPHFIPIL